MSDIQRASNIRQDTGAVLQRIMGVAERDFKDINAMMLKVFEEGGELAEAVNISTGAIKHKTTKEPLVGEVADVIQSAIAVLVRATPGLTAVARLQLLNEWLGKKTDKWESILPVEQPVKVGIQPVRVAKTTLAAAIGTVSKGTFIGKVIQAQKILPKVHVLIRKHPAGIVQPLGERRVYRMDTTSKPGRVFVGIGDGQQGWDLDLSKQTPSFLTFRLNGTTEPVTLQQAMAHWNSNGGLRV